MCWDAAYTLQLPAALPSGQSAHHLSLTQTRVTQVLLFLITHLLLTVNLERIEILNQNTILIQEQIVNKQYHLKMKFNPQM